MPVLGNEPLGLVEEARRRREIYARYIEKRVAAVLESSAIEQQIEAEVAERVRREVRRRVAERAARRLGQLRLRLPAEGPPLARILRAVADASALSVGELRGPRISGGLVLARQVAVLLLSELRPELSIPQIAQLLGGRDHKSILNARDRAAERIADPESHSACWYAKARARLFSTEV
jgi:chromosomal replication initiation ATPase DnaA